MSDSEFVYKPQDVNYLGFLEAQLRDMTGIDTLAYELIQNADDVQNEDGRFPVTTLSFDITDEALIVTNNGRFRPVDFERLQNIAGGGKRETREEAHHLTRACRTRCMREPDTSAGVRNDDIVD